MSVSKARPKPTPPRRTRKALARTPIGDPAEPDPRALRAELEEAKRDLESFCYSVSHDLRAPLRCIDGFSTALLHEFSGQLEPQARDYLQRIVESSRKMASLIDELLVLSRIQRAHLSVEPLDLSDLAHGVLDRLKATDPTRNVKISIAPHLRAPGDEKLVTLLLERLLENAWKFTSKTSSAVIEFAPNSAAEGGWMIRDNGAGFNPLYENKLFKLFQRLHSHTEFPGVGAGLALARAIVLRHHGRIRAEGAVGQGATFYFTFGPNSL